MAGANKVEIFAVNLKKEIEDYHQRSLLELMLALTERNVIALGVVARRSLFEIAPMCFISQHPRPNLVSGVAIRFAEVLSTCSPKYIATTGQVRIAIGPVALSRLYQADCRKMIDLVGGSTLLPRPWGHMAVTSGKFESPRTMFCFIQKPVDQRIQVEIACKIKHYFLKAAQFEACAENKNTLQKQRTSITRRELKCAYWMIKGKTIQDVAQILSVSDSTVRNDIVILKKKLGLSNTIELLARISKEFRISP